SYSTATFTSLTDEILIKLTINRGPIKWTDRFGSFNVSPVPRLILRYRSRERAYRKDHNYMTQMKNNELYSSDLVEVFHKHMKVIETLNALKLCLGIGE
ncbi:unnamed protein product, partial [marine sediment metagenome]